MGGSSRFADKRTELPLHKREEERRRKPGGAKGKRPAAQEGGSVPPEEQRLLETPAREEGWERGRKGNWGRWKSQQPQGLAQKRSLVSPRSVNRWI